MKSSAGFPDMLTGRENLQADEKLGLWFLFLHFSKSNFALFTIAIRHYIVKSSVLRCSTYLFVSGARSVKSVGQG